MLRLAVIAALTALADAAPVHGSLLPEDEAKLAEQAYAAKMRAEAARVFKMFDEEAPGWRTGNISRTSVHKKSVHAQTWSVYDTADQGKWCQSTPFANPDCGFSGGEMQICSGNKKKNKKCGRGQFPAWCKSQYCCDEGSKKCIDKQPVNCASAFDWGDPDALGVDGKKMCTISNGCTYSDCASGGTLAYCTPLCQYSSEGLADCRVGCTRAKCWSRGCSETSG
jgi:hypothetical protein